MSDLLDEPWQDIRSLLAAPASAPGKMAADDESSPGPHHHQSEPKLHLVREIAAEVQPKRWTLGDLIDSYGPWLSLFAAIGLTASGEYALAVLAGWPSSIAWLLPAAIDIYVTVALRRHRDLIPALGLMVVANAAFHLASQRLFGTSRDGRPLWWLVVGVAAIAPYVMWRVHELTGKAETAPVETAVSTLQAVSICSGPVGLALPETRTAGDQGARSPGRQETGTETAAMPVETAETRSRETRAAKSRETETPQVKIRSRLRETTETVAVAMGDRETEIRALLTLIETRGEPMAVSLNDAIETTGRPKATAAKRLAAARDRYRKSA